MALDLPFLSAFYYQQLFHPVGDSSSLQVIHGVERAAGGLLFA